MVINDLLNLGLAQKEAEVYLANLQLGMATAQRIAEKAEINRTTAYATIKNLISRGLIITVDKAGKQYFVAEKPDRLKLFCEQQEQEIKRRKETIDKIMPELESLYNLAADTPAVKLYKSSSDGLETSRKEILSHQYDALYDVYVYDTFSKNTNPEYIKKLFATTEEYYVLYVAKEKKIDPRLVQFIKMKKVKARYLPYDKFNLPVEVFIAGDTIYLTKTNNSLSITDALFAKTLKMFFLTLWGLGEEFDLEKDV